LTTDNFKVYLNAVDYAFGVDIDFATLEKHYVAAYSERSAAHRYSPARITGMKAAVVTGRPERQALDQLRGPAESDDAHAHASIHEAHECVQQEDRDAPWPTRTRAMYRSRRSWRLPELGGTS